MSYIGDEDEASSFSEESSESEFSDEISEVSDEEQDGGQESGNDVWDIIVQDTVEKHEHALKRMANNPDLFKKRFHKYFLENARQWLLKLHDFYEHDALRHRLWEVMEQMDHADDSQEALNMAIDQKKYKLINVIDWNHVENLLDLSAHSNEETKAEDNEDERSEWEDM